MGSLTEEPYLCDPSDFDVQHLGDERQVWGKVEGSVVQTQEGGVRWRFSYRSQRDKARLLSLTPPPHPWARVWDAGKTPVRAIRDPGKLCVPLKGGPHTAHPR